MFFYWWNHAFRGKLQRNRCYVGITEKVQKGTKNARSYFCTSILWIIFPCNYYILNDVTPFIEYLQVCSPRINFLKTGSYLKYIYTWSYANRVSKHFVICVNFPCLIACLLCCLLMSVFFACFLVRDFCRSECRQNYYLTRPPYFFPYPQFFVWHKPDSYLKSVRT